MDDNKTVFSYLGQILATFGNIVIIFMVFTFALGKVAHGYSSFFVFENKAISIATLGQLLAVSALLKCFEWAFLTAKFIKKMAMALRYVLFFATAFVTIVVFSICFKWFPLDLAAAWIGFGVSFIICTGLSILFSTLRTRAEDRKMEQALRRFKAEEEEIG